jgi:hypothetical protein
MESHFTKLAAIDVSAKIEKKQNLSYLSWAWAVDQLLRNDSNATWSYGDPVKWGETVMVFCTVTAFGKPMTAQLPVMDHRNKAIPNPDAFQVNTAMQRCLVKAIALHGLGLYIYAGEDLPPSEDEPTSGGLVQENGKLTRPKAERTAFMQVSRSIAEHLAEGREMGALQEWQLACDRGEDFAKDVWARLTTPERDVIRRLQEEMRTKEAKEPAHA